MGLSHGTVEHPPFIDDYPSYKPLFKGDFPASHV
jgi:hypothetical protein